MNGLGKQSVDLTGCSLHTPAESLPQKGNPRWNRTFGVLLTQWIQTNVSSILQKVFVTIVIVGLISLAFLILAFSPEFTSIEEQGTDENAR